MSRSKRYRSRLGHSFKDRQDLFLRLLDTPDAELRLALDALDYEALHDISIMTGTYCRTEWSFQETVRAACRARNSGNGRAWRVNDGGPSIPPIHLQV
jgi:hypothetical protein